MLARLRAKLSFANVVSVAALFVALGGSAYAVTTLDRNSVKSKHIVNGQVKSADVANDGLTGTDVNESRLGRVPTAADAERLDDLDSSDFARAGSEGWQAIALSSNVSFCHWTNFGNGFNPASFFRDAGGVVHLRGMIKANDGPGVQCGAAPGTDGRVNFGNPLPAGYRPENFELFTNTANNKPTRIDVLPDGLVLVLPGNGSLTWADVESWVSLDGISFRCGPSGVSGCP